MSEHDENGVNYWREEDAFDAFEDEEERDQEIEEFQKALIRLGVPKENWGKSEEELDAEIREAEFTLYLTYEERRTLDRNDPEAVAKACALVRSRERAQKRGEPLPADILSKPLAPSEVDPNWEPPPVEPEPTADLELLNAAPRCQHIKGNNCQCGSPARRGKRYCYFHDDTAAGRKRKGPVKLPVLEDARSLQMALTHVCRGVIDGRLDPKRATAVLYGLQVASTAVKATARGKRR